MQKLVNIVLADRGWILERCGKEIESRLPYVMISEHPREDVLINYYVNYSAWKTRVSPIEVGFFTHLEPSPESRAKYYKAASEMDACVCMSTFYANDLIARDAKNVKVIIPGVDTDSYAPAIRIGVVGRTYHTGRKGQWILEDIADIPGVDIRSTGEGWGADSGILDHAEMLRFFHDIDYLLVTALYEGGPLPVLEALSTGVKVISPPVGFVTEYPHIEYDPANSESLKEVLVQLVKENTENKNGLREHVLGVTWDGWAVHHHEMFSTLLKTRNIDLSDIHLVQTRCDQVSLVLHGDESTLLGGPSVRVKQLNDGLRKRGWRAELTREISTSSADIYHVFNIWNPKTALRTINEAKATGKVVVFSPIFLDLRMMIDFLTIPIVLRDAYKKGNIDEILMALAKREKVINTETSHEISEASEVIGKTIHNYESYAKNALMEADHVVFLSQSEMLLAKEWFGIVPVESTVVYNGVKKMRRGGISSFAFSKQFNVWDYVLCVGRIEPRKNQLMLVESLRGAGIPIVLIGGIADKDYFDLLMQRSNGQVVYPGRIDPDNPLLASAFLGARVFALPSWTEGGPLAAIEAGLAGLPLVTSNGGSEEEYFGDSARYCKPYDSESIRMTVMNAYESKFDFACQYRQIESLSKKFSIDQMVENTRDIYQYITNKRQLLGAARKSLSTRNFVGSLDSYDSCFVHGWVIDSNDPSYRPEVNIYVDDRLVATGVAHHFRGDLLAKGYGDGHYGFSVELPEIIFDDNRHKIHCKFGNELDAFLMRDHLILNQWKRRYHGFVDLVTATSISGWVRDIMEDSNKLEVVLVVDGVEVCTAVANILRLDLQQKHIGDGRFGFTVNIPTWLAYENRQHYIEVRIVNTSFALSNGTSVVNFFQLSRDNAIAILRRQTLEIDGTWKRISGMTLGSHIHIGKDLGSERYLLDGWSYPESWGVWSSGESARLGFYMDDVPDRAILQVRAKPFLPPKMSSQNVSISYADKPQVVFHFDRNEAKTINLVLEKRDFFGNKIVIEFFFPDAASPSEVGLGNDRRKLGIGLSDLVLVAA